MTFGSAWFEYAIDSHCASESALGLAFICFADCKLRLVAHLSALGGHLSAHWKCPVTNTVPQIGRPFTPGTEKLHQWAETRRVLDVVLGNPTKVQNNLAFKQQDPSIESLQVSCMVRNLTFVT
jgi:hypothetical protein